MLEDGIDDMTQARAKMHKASRQGISPQRRRNAPETGNPEAQDGTDEEAFSAQGTCVEPEGTVDRMTRVADACVESEGVSVEPNPMSRTAGPEAKAN